MGSMLIMLVPLVIMIIFMQRSQKKQQKERQDVLDSMKPGSEVITIGGLHGIISEANEKTVIIDCEGIFLEFDRTAIRTVKPATVSVEETIATEEIPETTEEVSEDKD